MDRSECSVGMACTWMHVPRGGYGYMVPVPGVVTKLGISRVRIEVKTHSGRAVQRWVRPESLRRPE